MSDQFDEMERQLKQELANLQRDYQMKAEPIIGQLVKIHSLRPPRPIIVTNGLWELAADQASQQPADQAQGGE